MHRLRLGEVIAAGGGVALLGLMWAPWYDGTNAWGAFAVIDVVLALAALLGIAAAVQQATRESPAWPVFLDVIGTVVAFVAVLLLVFRVLDAPGPRAWGLFAGFACCLAVLAGAWLAMRTE
jgi:hypothetical protein